MTGPRIDQGDELDRALAKIRAQSQPPDDIDAALAKIRGGGGAPSPGMDIHEEYRRGLLGKRMARENLNEKEQSEAESVGLPEAIGKAVTATQLNIGQGLPIIGGAIKAGQAGLASAASHLPGMGGARSYQQSLKDIDALTGQIPTPTRILGQAIPSVALAPLLGANPATAGAIMGYGAGSLSPDMEQGTLERTGKGLVGAGIGAVVGKLGEKAGTFIKSRLTPTPQANIVARQAARAESAARLYGAAQTEGEQNGANRAVRAFIQEPDVAERIAQLKTLEQYRHVREDSPEMMRALARSMSDEAKTLQKGLGQVDPSKPNTLRDKAVSLGMTKSRLTRVVSDPNEITTQVPVETAPQPKPTMREALNAFQRRFGQAVSRREGTPAQQMARRALERHSAENIVSPSLRGEPGTIEQTVTEPAMMPSFREAQQDFARRSAEIEAVGKGINAIQGATRGSTPTFKQIMSKETKTPETFQVWFEKAAPAEQLAALDGILGDVRNSAALPGKTFAPLRGRLAAAGPLLRNADPSQTTDILRLLGLINAGGQP